MPKKNSVFVIHGRDEKIDLERAETAGRRLVDGRTLLYGPTEQRTLQARNNLAELYRRQGKAETAARILEEVLQDCLTYLAEDDNSTFLVQHTLGVVCLEMGKHDRAEQVLSSAFEGRTRKFGPTHPATLVTLNALAMLYESKQDFSKAESLKRQLADAREKVLGADHRHTLTAHRGVGRRNSMMDGAATIPLSGHIQVRPHATVHTAKENGVGNNVAIVARAI